MSAKVKAGASKGSGKRSTKTSTKGPTASASKAKSGPRPAPTQHKPKPLTSKDRKKKPPHLRYTEKDLKVPQLNGIRPAGIQKPPNAKKGKTFVDDKESMNAIMALVMAEKEGNIESKMMRARQMEEVREARRIEAEKKALGKKQGLEERKQDIKKGNKQRRRSGDDVLAASTVVEGAMDNRKTKRKRVSFG